MTTPLAPVVRSATVSRTPAEAFDVFTEEIGAWWPLPTHGIFGEKAGGLGFRNGQLIEHGTNGDETVWGEVLEWNPPHRLVITWHPGQDSDAASQVEVSFEPDGDFTRVVVEHRGWEKFGEAAMINRRSYIGPNAWGGVLDHYADGAEPRVDGPDLSELAGAYQTFFDQAEQGDFGPAPDGEWNADQVLAHMALNDAAMLAVCQAIVHQQSAQFRNQVCQDREVLTQWIDACGERTELVRRCRVSAQQVIAALGRLSPDQLATEVHCHLTHDGEVVMDQAAPWHAIAITTQATRHLPAHINQLSNLRR